MNWLRKIFCRLRCHPGPQQGKMLWEYNAAVFRCERCGIRVLRTFEERA